VSLFAPPVPGRAACARLWTAGAGDRRLHCAFR